MHALFEAIPEYLKRRKLLFCFILQIGRRGRETTAFSEKRFLASIPAQKRGGSSGA